MTHTPREQVVLVDRDPGGAPLRADPGGVDHVAVVQEARRRSATASSSPGFSTRQLRGDLQGGHLQRGAGQLARHRGDRHADLDRAGRDGGLRAGAAGLRRQGGDPLRRARGGDVPADLDRRLAVRHLARDRPVRHLARADHPLHDVHAAAGDLHAVARSSARSRGSSSRPPRWTAPRRSRPSAR